MKNSKIIRLGGVLSLAIGLASCSSATTGFELPQSQVQFSGKIELNNEVDILFVIDNTSSMLQHQKNIASQLHLLIEDLNRLGMDYRIALTTTSMGAPSQSCPLTSRSIIGSPKILTPSSIQLLKSRFIVGKAGCDTERGLDALGLVTSPQYLVENRIEFMRPQALFVVAFISDENDRSFEFGQTPFDFIQMLNTRKPQFPDGRNAWIAHYIGSLSQSVSCDILGAPPEVGSRYLELVKFSQGTSASICNLDLSQAVSNIKSRIVGALRSYRFNEEPNPTTIRVRVDGREIANDPNHGWSLEKENDSFTLFFNGDSIPKANEAVEITFDPRYPR